MVEEIKKNYYFKINKYFDNLYEELKVNVNNIILYIIDKEISEIKNYHKDMEIICYETGCVYKECRKTHYYINFLREFIIFENKHNKENINNYVKILYYLEKIPREIKITKNIAIYDKKIKEKIKKFNLKYWNNFYQINNDVIDIKYISTLKDIEKMEIDFNKHIDIIKRQLNINEYTKLIIELNKISSEVLLFKNNYIDFLESHLVIENNNLLTRDNL